LRVGQRLTRFKTIWAAGWPSDGSGRAHAAGSGAQPAAMRDAAARRRRAAARWHLEAGVHHSLRGLHQDVQRRTANTTATSRGYDDCAGRQTAERRRRSSGEVGSATYTGTSSSSTGGSLTKRRRRGGGCSTTGGGGCSGQRRRRNKGRRWLCDLGLGGRRRSLGFRAARHGSVP
jgi:hypothetical protein